ALRTTLSGAGARVHVEPAQWLATSRAVARIEVTGAPVRLRLPAIFTRTAGSGLRFASVTPAPRDGTVTVRAGGALVIRDLGLPARTYAIAARSGARRLGTLRLRVLAPSREAPEDAVVAPAQWRLLRAPALATQAGDH